MVSNNQRVWQALGSKQSCLAVATEVSILNFNRTCTEVCIPYGHGHGHGHYAVPLQPELVGRHMGVYLRRIFRQMAGMAKDMVTISTVLYISFHIDIHSLQL